MAARENQGLQIALILFVMITVVLAVTTYIYYRKSEEKVKEAQAAVKRETDARAEAEAHKNATEVLRAMLGASTKNAAEIKDAYDKLTASSVAVKEDIKKIDEKFKADMQMFAADFGGDKNYTTLPPYLLTVISDKSVAVADGLAREAGLRDERDKAVEGERAKTKVAEQLRDKALADKDTVKAEFDTDRTRFTTETAALSSTVQEKAKELKEKTDTFTKDLATKETQFQTVNKLKEELDAKLIGMREESFEVPDGKINWVNQRTNVVWVNLGSADGLRRQITFSVFGKDETNLKKADAKGSLEVTRIIDEHLAECRIVSSKNEDPLVPGDLVFSPVWHPGQTMRFALAGLIDYNNDGKSDRALVQSLIQMNGGVIDAEVGDDGKLSGKMSVDTRYLVVGKRPDEKSSKEALDAFSKMTSDAKLLGIEQIPVSKFLDFMGYKGEVNTVTLGKGASGDDFKAKNADGVIKKSMGPTAEFKNRTPPARGKDGAF